jgi:hypothetical protein
MFVERQPARTVEFSNRLKPGEWLGVWDELCNWIVTAA